MRNKKIPLPLEKGLAYRQAGVGRDLKSGDFCKSFKSPIIPLFQRGEDKKYMFAKIKPFFKKFFAIDDDPHKIAAGAALGIFWGIMPGEGVATTLITATIFKLNRAGALAGVVASNMWLTFVVLPIASAVGGFLFHENSTNLVAKFHQTYDLGHRAFLSKLFLLDIALPLIAGFLIVSVTISLSFYGVIYLLLKYHKLK